MANFGPFHRVKSPTQTFETALKQKMSGEIWGRAINHGGRFPTVKAYDKALCFDSPTGTDCVDCEGIEFVTTEKPCQRTPAGSVFWRLPENTGLNMRKVDEETVALKANVYKLFYSEANSPE